MAEVRFLDEAEHELVAEVLAVVRRVDPARHVSLEATLARLRRLAEIVRDCPPLTASAAWWGDRGARAYTVDSLVEQLCRVHDYDLELHMPTKAVLGQAFLVAKINLLKALGYSLASAGGDASLVARVEREVAQSIYTKLAEELFESIVTDERGDARVRQNAAKHLMRIWEERLELEVDDFAPLLESAWEARARVVPVLGTLLGTHEVFRLFREARDKRLLDHFGEDDVGEDELLAFEEFLFGLSHEEIGRLRAHMLAEARPVITLDQARALLGDLPSTVAAANAANAANAAQALYSSYKKRKVNAQHRASTGAPGPKRTAEEWVMLAVVARERA